MDNYRTARNLKDSCGHLSYLNRLWWWINFFTRTNTSKFSHLTFVYYNNLFPHWNFNNLINRVFYSCKISQLEVQQQILVPLINEPAETLWLLQYFHKICETLTRSPILYIAFLIFCRYFFWTHKKEPLIKTVHASRQMTHNQLIRCSPSIQNDFVRCTANLSRKIKNKTY